MINIVQEKMTVEMDGDFVVFIIGMRINKLWKIHKWLPVSKAMVRMIRELKANPELGFMGFESWFGRTTLMVQYWKSIDHLLDYAQNKDAEHTPAWLNFNEVVRKSGDVGIWHETYISGAGRYECVYTNMPRFGLAKHGNYVPAREKYHSAKGRLGLVEKYREK